MTELELDELVFQVYSRVLTRGVGLSRGRIGLVLQVYSRPGGIGLSRGRIGLVFQVYSRPGG